MRRPDARRGRRTGHCLVALVAVIVVAAPHAGAAPPPTTRLEPYLARYHVSYRGVSGGRSQASLTHGPTDGTWQYQTRAFPNFLGRLAISAAATEHGTMQITDAGVRPLELRYDDGSSEQDKDIHVVFDWDAQRVTGEANGKPFDYPVEPGTQDTASAQAAILVELLAGRSPDGFPMVSGGKLRDYRYWSEGEATIVTPAGRFETVIWASQGEGSSRVSKVWHAPELGYVPVQAVQYRKGKPELSMKLVSLRRP